MAIFFNHIKGCGNQATGQTAQYEKQENKYYLTRECWGWLQWSSTIYKDTNNENKLAHSDSIPDLFINDGNTIEGRVSLGKLITAKATHQKIESDFEFTQRVTINNLYMNTDGANSSFLDQNWYFGSQTELPSDSFVNSSILNFSLESGTNLNDFAYPYVRMYLEKSSGAKPNYDFYIRLLTNNNNISPKMTFESPDFLFKSGNMKIAYNLYVGSGSSDTTHGIIKADNKCEALYFNATSDRRAKSNITPAEFSALSVVKQLPVYTFNYLNMEEPAIGLIAQEAAKHNLNGFNMVDNLDASGEFGDFMQMKESKLVYVLWKAVQELSAEVETLKAEIRNLK